MQFYELCNFLATNDERQMLSKPPDEYQTSGRAAAFHEVTIIRMTRCWLLQTFAVCIP